MGDTRLRELSRPRRPTLRDLAERAGVSYSLTLKIAAGIRRPNAAVRTATEELYDIPAFVIFGDDEARPRRAPS